MKRNYNRFPNHSFSSYQSASLQKLIFRILAMKTKSVLFASAITRLESSTSLCLVCIVSTRIVSPSGLNAKTLVPYARPKSVMSKKTQEAVAKDTATSKDLSEMYLFLMIEIATEADYCKELVTIVLRILLEILLTVKGSSRVSRSDQ